MPYVNCSTPGGDTGAVASAVSVTPDPLVVVRCTARQPFPVSELNGASVNTVRPDGSLGHPAAALVPPAPVPQADAPSGLTGPRSRQATVGTTKARVHSTAWKLHMVVTI